MAEKDKGKQPERQTLEGDMPEVGAEGGILKEGTGDFAPGGRGAKRGATSVETVTTTTPTGREVEVEAGQDSSQPVSVNNPPAKAVIGRSELQPAPTGK